MHAVDTCTLDPPFVAPEQAPKGRRPGGHPVAPRSNNPRVWRRSSPRIARPRGPGDQFEAPRCPRCRHARRAAARRCRNHVRLSRKAPAASVDPLSGRARNCRTWSRDCSAFYSAWPVPAPCTTVTANVSQALADASLRQPHAEATLSRGACSRCSSGMGQCAGVCLARA